MNRMIDFKEMRSLVFAIVNERFGDHVPGGLRIDLVNLDRGAKAALSILMGKSSVEALKRSMEWAALRPWRTLGRMSNCLLLNSTTRRPIPYLALSMCRKAPRLIT